MDYPLDLICPYPTADDAGGLKDGLSMAQASFCSQRCTDRPCRLFFPAAHSDRIDYVTCPFGFSVALARIESQIVRVNGVIEASSNSAPAEFRKRHRDRKLKAPELEAWVARARAAAPAFERSVHRIAEDSISALHEIKAIIGTLLHTTENWIWRQEGTSIDDRVEKSPEELRTIYHSCRILESLLQMTDILANPASATFGAQAGTPVYKILFMLVKVFRARADARGIKLTLGGSSFNRPRLYKSFVIVPLVILDNAIKYAESNSEILVSAADRSDGSVNVEISSYGQLIPEVERDSIFKRGFRGSNVATRGSGLGLFVAKTIADANGFLVKYAARAPVGARRGANVFSFTVAG